MSQIVTHLCIYVWTSGSFAGRATTCERQQGVHCNLAAVVSLHSALPIECPHINAPHLDLLARFRTDKRDPLIYYSSIS